MSIRLNNELPSKHESWPNAGLLLGQRRRRWVNSKPTLGQRLMFAGVWLSLEVLGHLHRRIQELTDGGGGGADDWNNFYTPHAAGTYML